MENFYNRRVISQVYGYNDDIWSYQNNFTLIQHLATIVYGETNVIYTDIIKSVFDLFIVPPKNVEYDLILYDIF